MVPLQPPHNITVLEPAVDFIYNPNSLVLTRNETMSAASPMFGSDATADEWGISPALPEGLNFANGTVSGTLLVNMTATAPRFTPTTQAARVWPT